MDDNEKYLRVEYLSKLMYYLLHDVISPIVDELADIRDNWDWSQGSNDKLKDALTRFMVAANKASAAYTEYLGLTSDITPEPAPNPDTAP